MGDIVGRNEKNRQIGYIWNLLHSPVDRFSGHRALPGPYGVDHTSEPEPFEILDDHPPHVPW